MTAPLRFSASPAPWTWAGDESPPKLTVSTVPPAKSMPRRKPFRHIERLPGMMISSESAKKRFRRPMMLSLRTRGAGATTAASWAFPSSTMSATWPCGVTADSWDAVHPQQGWASEAPRGQHDRQQVVSDDDRRDEAGEDTDPKRERESFHRRGSDESKDDAGDERRRVGVANGGPGAADRGVHRRCDRASRSYLFFLAFKDQDVGVHRHAHRHGEGGGTRPRPRHRV